MTGPRSQPAIRLRVAAGTAGIAALVAGIGACGSTPTPAGTAEPDRITTVSDEPTAPETLELIDVSTAEPVRLRSFTPEGTPVLLWFWAPH